MILNIPNALTMFRILLVPVFIYFITDDKFYTATVVFAVAGLTDAVDGFIARTFNRKTDLGANLDPLADKLLLSSSYIMLTVKGFVPLWLCVPVIIRDIVILTGVLMLRGSGRKVKIAPTIFGKLTTIFQITTVIYAMVFAGRYGNTLFSVLAGSTAVLTLYTGFDYGRREFKIQYRGGRQDFK